MYISGGFARAVREWERIVDASVRIRIRSGPRHEDPCGRISLQWTYYICMDGRTRGWLALETKELGRRCGAALLSLYSDSGSKHGQAGADTRFSHRVDRISGSGPFELESELAARQGSVDVATESAPITETCGERMRQMRVLDALGWPRGARDRLVSCRVVLAELS